MKKILFCLIASATIFCFFSCKNPSNLSNGNNDIPPDDKPQEDIPPAFKAPDIPVLPENVGENPFAGKKYKDTMWENSFISFTESEVIYGTVSDGKEIIDYINNYAYDTENNYIYMTVKKYTFFDNCLFTWDETVAKIKEQHSFEFMKLRYQESNLESLQEDCECNEIPFEETDTREVLIDKLVKNEIEDMKNHYYLPKETSDEEVLEYVAEEDAEYYKEYYDVFLKYSYKIEDDFLSFASVLDDDFKLEGLTDYRFWNNFYEVYYDLDFEIDFYSDGDFHYHNNEKDYIFEITEITENKIKSTLSNAFGDDEAPETLELDYTITGKGNDIIITITCKGNSMELKYRTSIEEYFLDV